MSGSGSGTPVNRNSNFNRWNSVKNERPRTIAQATHLLLSGGKVLVAADKEEELLRALAKDMDANIPNYLVEKRTEVFRFCQDYDLLALNENGVDRDLFFSYLKVVQRTLKDIFPDADRTMIICSAPNKPRDSAVTVTLLEKNDNGHWREVETKEERRPLTKSGYHVIFPHILVNKQESIKVRFILLQVLQEKFGILESERVLDDAGTKKQKVQYDSWDDILDLTIYQANGLRMLGSSKAAPCKKCKKKNERTKPCEDCQNTRYIDEGRPYKIFAVLDGEGDYQESLTKELQQDNFRALQLTTIRHHGSEITKTIEMPHWFRLQEELDKCLGIRRKRSRTTAELTPEKWGEEGQVHNVRLGNRSATGEVISAENDPRARVFYQLLRDSVGPVIVSKMIIFPESKSIWAVVSGGFCANVGRCHTGQDIYYQYTPRKGIVQRCWSSKTGSDRKHGPCTGKAANAFFDSQAITVPKQKQTELFPPISVTDNQLVRPTNANAALELSNAPNNRHPRCTAQHIHLQQLFETIYLTEKRKVENPFSYFKPESVPNRRT